MGIQVSFNVSFDNATPFIWPVARTGYPVCRPPIREVGHRVNVTAMPIDSDPNLDAILEADLVSAAPADSDLPASWSPETATLDNAAQTQTWTFTTTEGPSVSTSVTFQASWTITGAHPQSGQTVAGSLTLDFVASGTLTLPGVLPALFHVLDPATGSEITVHPGELVHVPSGKSTWVRCDADTPDPSTGADRLLVDVAPYDCQPPLPDAWKPDESVSDQWYFTPTAPGYCRFTTRATLYEQIASPLMPIPTSNHQLRGQASIALTVDPAGAVTTETHDQLLANARKTSGIPAPDPTQIDGIWYDPSGREVVIDTADSIGLRFSAGAGTVLLGTGTGPQFHADGVFATADSLPVNDGTGAATLLIGAPARYTAEVSADGRTISGWLEIAASATGTSGLKLVLTRRALVYGVAVVCTSLRDLLTAADATRAWNDNRLMTYLGYMEGTSQEDDTHLLMVMGAYLPAEQAGTDFGGNPALVALGPDAIQSADTTVQYQPDRPWNTRNTTVVMDAKHMLLPYDPREAAWDSAWLDLARKIGPGAAAQVQSDLDALLIVVRPQQGALPGPRTFTLGGANVSWNLTTSVTRASLDFVRNVKWQDVWLATDTLVLNGAFWIQIRVNAPIDRATLDVTLKLQGTANQVITLTKWDLDPKVYHSGPLMIVKTNQKPSDPAGATMIESDADSASVEMVEPILRLALPVTTASIVVSPGDRQAYYPDHLNTAAQTDNVDSNDKTVVDQFYSVVVFDSGVALGPPPGFNLANSLPYIPLIKGGSDVDVKIPIPLLPIPGAPTLWISPGIRSTKVSLGNHAAALLLKAQFLRFLAQSRSSLNDDILVPDGHVAALLRTQYWDIVRGQSILSKVHVTDPNGADVELKAALHLPTLRRQFNARSNAQTFSESAVRQAVTNLIAAVDDANQMAVTIANNDIKGLLKLCGNGFEPIVSRTLPLLMFARC